MSSTEPRRVRRSWAWRYRRLLFLIWLVGFGAVAVAVFLLTRVPLPDEQRLAQTTILTDIHGQPLASLEGGVNRVPVSIDHVPQVVIDAVVATEDRNFFRHGGVDPVGVLRATVSDIRGSGNVQGGSTITQQYVKNTYVGHQRTLWRKLKEAALALKVEQKYTKREILERYLNTIYFGRGAYGVQAAARSYFGKDVGELRLPEAAYLAGLIRAPQRADAKRDPKVAAARRSLTLRALVRQRKISEAQRQAVEVVPVESYVVVAAARGVTVVSPEKGTQYFVDFVQRQLLDQFGETEVFTGGLRVRTTLDVGLQGQAYDAIYGFLRPGEPAGALVAIDDQGQIVAMVGGRDWNVSKVNLAVGRDGGGAGRQAGSTFKPFLLAETVHEGFSVQSAFPGPPKVIIPKADNGADWTVSNFEDEDAGPSVNLIDATAQSVNTVYAQLETAIGPQHLADMAHQLGVKSALAPNASLVLGTDDVSVLEMASAYSTFANRGVRVDPVSILDVTTADGTVLFRSRPLRTKVLERSQADIVNYCLRQVVERGSGTGAGIDAQVAGKTGTTENYGDAWFVGFTPKLTTAVWMGWPEGSSRQMTNVRGRKVNGGSFPATMWRRFMVQATKGVASGGFPTPVSFPGKRVTGVRAVIPTTTTTTTAPASSTASTAGPAPAPAASPRP